MKKWLKWGIAFVILHIVIITVSTYMNEIFGKYAIIMDYFVLLIYCIYELPLIFIGRLFNTNFEWLSNGYLIFHYIIGSLLYFFIGVSMYYLFRNRASRKVR